MGRKRRYLDEGTVLVAGKCMKLAWYRVHRPGRGGGNAAARLGRRHKRDVTVLVRALFPGGRRIVERNIVRARRSTRKALCAGKTVLFRPAFLHDGVAIRPDILERRSDGAWNVWAVKASSGAERHFQGLAVEVHILRNLGFRVVPGVIHLDRNATVRSASILKRTVCARQVERLLPEIGSRIRELKRRVRIDYPRPFPLKRICGRCERLHRCRPDLPERNVFLLFQGDGGWRVVDELIEREILDLDELPDEMELTHVQKRQMAAFRSGRGAVSGDPARSLAERTEYPLFFLDFETVSPAVPRYRAQHPFDIIPFQWSCHLVRGEGGPAEHFGYLHDDRDGGDPRRGVIESLLSLLGGEGTILVYSGYERRVIERMAEVHRDLARPLRALVSRIFDLHEFVEHCYYVPRFGGSFSMKSVYAALHEGRSYRDLGVSDGTAAVEAFLRLVEEKPPPEERKRIRENLIEYCKRDTATIESLYRRLMKVRAEC